MIKKFLIIFSINFGANRYTRDEIVAIAKQLGIKNISKKNMDALCSRQQPNYPIAIIIDPDCLQTYPYKHYVQFLYEINDEYRVYGKLMYGNAIWAMFKNMMTKAWEVEHFSQYERRRSLENPDQIIFEYFSNPNIRSNSRPIDIDEWMKMSHAFDDPPNTDDDDTHSADDTPDGDDDDTHYADDTHYGYAANKNKVAEAMNTLQITELTLENVK